MRSVPILICLALAVAGAAAAQDAPANPLAGKRFVSLEIPDNPAARALQTGDVIPQDRTTNAVELEQAFEHLLPVLQAVQPDKLSATLTAISTALSGRGKPLGETLSQLGTYIGDLNPHTPELEHNLQALTEFSGHLSSSAPDLVQSLDNLSTIMRTVVDQRQNLANLYGSMTNAAVDLQTFLQANSDNIIHLASTARPTAELLAKYAPEYPCVISQMKNNVPLIDQALGKGTNQPGLHATIEIVAPRAPYQAGKEEPRFEDKRGPRCYDIKNAPNPFPSEPPDGAFKDGTIHQSAPKSVGDGLNPANFKADAAGLNGGGAAGGNPAYSGAEQDFLAQLLGPQLGMDADLVPDWASLLVGPLYRGAEVNFK